MSGEVNCTDCGRDLALMCRSCETRDLIADEKAEGRAEKAEARVAELEAGIRSIIAYEWGKTEDGHEVAPSHVAVPAEQKAWRDLAALLSPSVGGPTCRCPEHAEGKHRLSCVRDQVVLPVTGEPPRTSDASPLVRCWRCKHDVPEDSTICNAGVGTQCRDSKACRGRWYGPQRTNDASAAPDRKRQCYACGAKLSGAWFSRWNLSWCSIECERAYEDRRRSEDADDGPRAQCKHFPGATCTHPDHHEPRPQEAVTGVTCSGCGDYHTCPFPHRSDNALRDEDVQAVLWREAEIKAERNRLREELLDLRSTVRALWDQSFASDDAALWDRLEKLVGSAPGNRSGKAEPTLNAVMRARRLAQSFDHWGGLTEEEQIRVVDKLSEALAIGWTAEDERRAIVEWLQGEAGIANTDAASSLLSEQWQAIKKGEHVLEWNRMRAVTGDGQPMCSETATPKEKS